MSDINNIVYIDMDDTIADFLGHPKIVLDSYGHIDLSAMYKDGFFMELKPIEGSVEAIANIEQMGYDVRILTKPVYNRANSYSEKAQWIETHFPSLLQKINMTQDKTVFRGGYLVDDDFGWMSGFNSNGGTFIHFDTLNNHVKEWESVVERLYFAKNQGV